MSVTQRARAFLTGSCFCVSHSPTAHGSIAEKLAGSKYSSPEDLANMTDCFHKATRLRFRNPDESSYIKFGGVRDKDLEVGICSGQLKLPR